MDIRLQSKYDCWGKWRIWTAIPIHRIGSKRIQYWEGCLQAEGMNRWRPHINTISNFELIIAHVFLRLKAYVFDPVNVIGRLKQRYVPI